MQNAQNHNDVTFAYSPYITWALSHWNQLRLQYTHTDHNAASGLRPDDAIYLQWAWIIGVPLARLASTLTWFWQTS